MKRISTVLVLLLASLLAPALARAAGSDVRFTSPAAGSHVHGTVDVSVTADPSTTTVLFEWSGDGGTTWNTIGTDADPSGGWSQSWDTTSAGDGPVELRATATESGGPSSNTESVAVDNTAPAVTVTLVPRAFSPNGDGRKDRARVEVTLSEASSLAVRVYDAGGHAVGTLDPGDPAPKGTHAFRWDGMRGGTRVADGLYRVRAVATDAAGNRGRGSGGVRVDTTAPLARWGSVRPETASRSPVTARFTLHDPSGIGHASIDVLDEAGVLRVVHLAHATTGPQSARVPFGSSPMPGMYRLQLGVTDAAGNTRRSGDISFRVLHPVKTTVYGGLSGVGRRVSLTFDDCNDGSAWNRILDILAARDLHTTFFCIGGNVERYASTARRTLALGDSVGDHTWDHADLQGMSLAAQEGEIRKQADAWWRVAHVTPAPYFRPPYGAYDSTTLEAAGRLGFSRTMLWDVDPQDWRRPGASVIAQKVLGAIHPGAVVVMHVQDQTADALPTILAGLRHRHLLQSSLPELFAAAGKR